MAFGNIGNGTVIELTSEQLQDIIHETLLEAHPIGSIYQSIDNTDPSILFGGTWERIEGRFIMGASDTYPAGSTGGEAAVALTEENNGPHTHIFEKLVTGASDTNPEGNTVQRGHGTNGSNNVLRYPDNFQLSTSGEGQPHNNIPPYYSMYIWRRVA